MGSAGAIVCSIYLGLIQTLLMGGALYLMALVILRSSFAAERAEGTPAATSRNSPA
jgi:hypothetical protein